MTYTYELKTADGDDAGTLLTSECNWQQGDTVKDEEPIDPRRVGELPFVDQRKQEGKWNP